MKTVLTAGAVALIAGTAAADLRVTELYSGVSGPDGTPDWFELTNEGVTDLSTAGLFYDDNSFDATKDDALANVTIGAGESVIFLVSWEDDYTDVADAIADFVAFWGDVATVSYVDGGSGLGGGGDAVAIFDGNLADSNLVTSAAYNDAQGGAFATTEYPTGPVGQLSTLGVNGAFESLLGAGDSDTPIVGSPGVVPSPAGVAALALGGLVAGRRRR